uniref:SH3 domain containing kinase binding protein 1 n=1 Tax=Seriola lalandi dorsalis TaxID=1841481 RepID=A0A3B4ZDF3_SERLL
MSLTVGDIIVNIRRDDGGWWEGELGGRRGLFPDNFVREIKKEAKRDGGQASMIRSDLANGRASPVSDPGVRPGRKGDQIRKRRCKAAFSYVPQHEDELELKIGDVIEIIAEVEEGWWEGVLNGKTGMFPSNFTKEILKESDTPSVDTPTPQEEVRSARTSKDSPGSESDGGDSRSETGSGEIQPKKVRGFGFGDIFKDQPIKLRPRSMEIDSEVDKFCSLGLLCKVLFPYENITWLKCWWMGEIGGRQGVFPDNFVKLLEVEKEVILAGFPCVLYYLCVCVCVCLCVCIYGSVGEEVKVGDIPKPSLPTLLPKKPLPPKTSSSSSSQPPRRPERPPPLASVQTHVDLDAVVASTEKLSHPTASRPRVTDRRPRSQIITSVSVSAVSFLWRVLSKNFLRLEDRKERGKEEQEPVPPRSVDVSQRKGVPTISANDSKAPLPTKPSVLTPPNAGHRPASPSSSLGLSPSPELRHSPLTSPTLEELRNQLRDLRTSVEQLKNQHRQEMKHLASALDEEKKIRVNLQLEVDHIKKNLSK